MKPTSDSMVSPNAPAVEGLPPRRSFICRAGAALSGTLAVAAAAGTVDRKADEASALKEQLERLSSELGILEDTSAIRKLHEAFSYALNKRLYEDVVNLFSDDSEVHFNGGIFVGKNHGVRRLYVQHFGQSFADMKHEPIHGALLDQPQHQQDVVEVAPDRQSAWARFHCMVQAQAAVASNLPIMEMARQQGQGIVQWWESGVYENVYVKEGESWKIRQLAYRTISQAQRALDGSYSRSSDIPYFSTTYPDNPAGPDKLSAPAA